MKSVSRVITTAIADKKCKKIPLGIGWSGWMFSGKEKEEETEEGKKRWEWKWCEWQWKWEWGV